MTFQLVKRRPLSFPLFAKTFSSCWNPWCSKEEWVLSPCSREKWVWRHFLWSWLFLCLVIKKSPMILSFQGEISNVFSQIVTFEMSSKYTSNDEWATHFTNCRNILTTWIFTKVPFLCNVHSWSSVPNFAAYFNISDCQVSRVGITGFVEYTLQNIICNIFRAFHMVILA